MASYLSNRGGRSRHANRLVLAGIVLVAAAMLFAVAACGESEQGSEGASTNPNWQNNSGAGDALTILTWADYEDPAFFPRFVDEHPDVELNWAFMTSSSEGYSKFASGFEADMIDIIWTGLPASQGLTQPVDTSKLSNWDNVPEGLRQVGQWNGVQYGIPIDFGYSSIIVRTDKVATLPDSWNALWDPQYKGEVAMYDNAQGAFNAAALALGVDLSGGRLPTDDEVQQITDKLIELKHNCKYLWTDASALAQDLKAGTVTIAYAWTSTYGELKNEGVPVDYIAPVEGMLAYSDMLHVSANTKNYDLCLALIDAYLDVEPQVKFINDWGYGPGNSEAIPLADQEQVSKLLLDDPNLMDKVFFYPDETEELRQIYNDTWAAVKAAP